MILADIGNSYFHIYDGEKVEHLTYEDAIDTYRDETLYYISVKHQLTSKIEAMENWKNISSLMKIDGEYDTMGVDRKALCLSHENGIFVDAGSAITVDVVTKGRYTGGFILPGLKAYLKSYKSISLALDIDLSKDLKLTHLPTTTKEQISYGIITSIKALIDKHSDGKKSNNRKLYFTGGDGMFLSQYFEKAVYDEMLVFDGMRQVLKDKKIC